MITVVSDTHGETGHRLEGAVLESVRSADLVLHAGDLTTAAVDEAVDREADRFAAVRGNNDPSDERLPLERVVEHGNVRIALVHGHRHHGTAVEMVGREAAADLVVFGHSHRPGFDERGEVPRLNPGSHAHPRMFRPAYAELHTRDGRLSGRLKQPDGTVMEEFTIPITRRD
jgi:putative phosphoesterase